MTDISVTVEDGQAIAVAIDTPDEIVVVINDGNVGQAALAGALAAQVAAELAETNAQSSEDDAQVSEDAAAASAAAALASELAAQSSEDDAQVSEDAAAVSETNTAVSAAAALVSENNAQSSEDDAQVSEDAAAVSETNAATSETNAATSETNAATSAAAALVSEGAAAASAASIDVGADLDNTWTGANTFEQDIVAEKNVWIMPLVPGDSNSNSYSCVLQGRQSGQDVIFVTKLESGKYIMRASWAGGSYKKILEFDYNGIQRFFRSETEVFKISDDVTVVGDNTLFLVESGDLELGQNGSSGGDAGIIFYSDISGKKTFLGTDGEDFSIRANATSIYNGEQMMRMNADGGVELFYDAVKHAFTTADGFQVTGDMEVTDTLTVASSGAHNDWRCEDAASILNSPVTRWTADDSDAYMYVDGDTKTFILGMHDGVTSDSMLKAVHGAGVQLHFDNAVKLETVTNGVEFTGLLDCTGDIDCDGEMTMRGSVLTLTSDAAAEDRSLEFLNDEGGLHLSLSTNAGIGVLSQRGTSGDFENYWMQCHRDGGVGLYHDGLLRLLTTAEGIDVMDDITLQDGGALWTSDSTGVDSKSAFFEHYLHLGNYGSFSSATYAHLNFHTYAGGTASYDARILCNTGSGHATLAGRGHLYYYAGTHEWQQDGVQAMRNSLSGGYPLFETWGQHICWGYTTANASLSIVGHSTSNSHSNTVWYDNVPTAVAYMRNDGIIYATNFLGTSDRNRKRAIIDETSSRHELRQIKPVNFEFIADHEREGETMRRTGFIAQDVLPHIPEAITWTEGTPDQVQADGTVLKGAPASFAMELPAMIPTLWNSTRELDEEVEAQKLVNTRQRNNITALEEAVALLQTQVAALVAAA